MRPMAVLLIVALMSGVGAGAGAGRELADQPQTASKDGSVGDTPERLAECYGKPVERVDDPQYQGAMRYTYKTNELTVMASVGENKCGQLVFTTKDGGKVGPEVVERLLKANEVPGIPWQKMALGESPRWAAKGTRADGTRVFRMAMDLPEKFVVGDLDFQHKFPMKPKDQK